MGRRVKALVVKVLHSESEGFQFKTPLAGRKLESFPRGCQ